MQDLAGAASASGGRGGAGPRGTGCQVHGCTADPDEMQPFYKRLRVCALHTNALTVLDAKGNALRFCRQCLKLEPVSAFHYKLHSCKASLAKRRELRAAAVHAHKRAKVACSASQQASPNTPGPQGGSAGAAPAPAPVAGAVSALPPNRPAGAAAAAALQPAPVQQQPAGTQVQPNQPVAAAAAAPQAAPAQQQPAGAQAQPNQLVFPVAVMPGRHEMLEQLADILPPIHVWDRPPRLLDMYRQAEQQLDAVWRRPAGMLAAAAPPLFALPQAPAYLPLVPPPPPPPLNRIDYRAPMPRPLHADQDPLLQMARELEDLFWNELLPRRGLQDIPAPPAVPPADSDVSTGDSLRAFTG